MAHIFLVIRLSNCDLELLRTRILFTNRPLSKLRRKHSTFDKQVQELETLNRSHYS